ncbi:MAG: transposase [bacterium]|nr:transposase [bacterium]
MSRNVQFAEGEFYHLYNRGTERRNIFSLGKDYERFLSLLLLCNGTVPVDLKLHGKTLAAVKDIERGEPLIDIGAYCLMPNHFHLIVREKTKSGISRFMQKLTTGYTMYFNKRHERSGALFQGRFKAVHANKDNYLSYLISYIHLNPVKLIEPEWKTAGIKNHAQAAHFLKEYHYSSFPDYSGQERLEGIILQKNALPEYNESPAAYEKSLAEWLNYKVQPSQILQG